MFRLVYVAFLGKFRGAEKEEEALHESPRSMTIPLTILGILAAIGGFIGIPHIFHLPNVLDKVLEPLIPAVNPVHYLHNVSTEWKMMGISVAIAIAGWLIAGSLYRKESTVPDKLATGSLGYIYKLVLNKYYVDEIYSVLVIRPVKRIGDFFWYYIDVILIDGAVNLAGMLATCCGRVIGLFQNGSVKMYAFSMLTGILILFWIFVG